MLGLYAVVAHVIRGPSHGSWHPRGVGATPTTIVGLLARNSIEYLAVETVGGVALGAIAGTALVRVLPNLQSPRPALFVVAVVVLVLIAMIATLIPSIRAARLHPTVALRSI